VLAQVGSSVRYDTSLDDRCREIAILLVARTGGLTSSVRARSRGRSVGLSDAELAAVRDGRHAALAGARPRREHVAALVARATSTTRVRR